MPQLTFFGLPVDGDNRDAVVVRNLIHDESSPEDSLNIINGLLDWENIDAGWTVSKEYTQRGSAIDGVTSARTVNLDWSYRIFGTYQTGSFKNTNYGTNTVNNSLTRPIPGACREFYSKWDGYALVTWSVFFGNDNSNASYLSSVLLVANDSYQTSQMRNASRCASYFYQRARVWSGHAIVQISEGFNSVGLHMIADSRIRMTRTWASNIQVLPFKYNGGG